MPTSHRLERLFPARWRRVTVFIFDLLAVSSAWVAAGFLATSFEPGSAVTALMGQGLVPVIALEAIIFRLMGLYRGIWIYSSLQDLQRIAKAIGFSVLVLLLASFVIPVPLTIPMAMLILYPLLLLTIMGGGRAAYRIWKERGRAAGEGAKPILILGAGTAAARLTQALAFSQDWQVVGLLDDNPAKHGREIHGNPVLGSIADLPLWAERLSVRNVVLALPSVKAEKQRHLIDICVQAGVKTYKVPTTDQLLSGQDRVDDLRPVDVNDLLGRNPVSIDLSVVGPHFLDKCIMVTGAGGSIGSELCCQIARLKPGQIVLFDISEYALYTILETLQSDYPDVSVIPLVGDVKDGGWVAEVFRRYAPSIVFHAAAYKHVPLMEDLNAWQAVRNNVLGTYVVAQAAIRAEVGEFVLVSSDKAVNPVNVMGATKRLSETTCLALQALSSTTRFEIVRFGNVLGSTGSVIPKFLAQIERGGPLTVTHPEMTRYFMSVAEASQLVLQAAAIGEGGDIFVLDMGTPVRIVDLARNLIRFSGRHESEIRIIFSGLRPGEKLFEETFSAHEQTRPTSHPKLRVAKGLLVPQGWLNDLLEWMKESKARTDSEVRRDMRRFLSDYKPASPPELRPVANSR